MLRINGNVLNADDKQILQGAARYTFDYLLSREQQKGSSVFVCVGPATADDEGLAAYTTFHINQRGTKCVRIWLHESRINRRCKDPVIALKPMIRDLMHELVHAKQYITGELKDLDDERYKFCGKVYNMDGVLGVDYFERPHEIEAYGREPGLWDRFKRLMADE
jgi:hypothetical protein